MTPSPRTIAALAGLTMAATPLAAEDWVGTWTASAQPVWGDDFAVGIGMPGNFWNQTLRQTARVSLGGDEVRIELSNLYGEFPVRVGAATIAISGEGAAIEAPTALTFSGEAGITIPPGGTVLSDAAAFDLPDLTEVAVSVYFPEVAPVSTVHWDGHNTAYIGGGDLTAAADMQDAQTMTKRAFLTEIMVARDVDTDAVVLFGDSITDGDGSTIDGNDRWPDVLAERLLEAGIEMAVQNQGISGAKVLSDRMGANALARFERDVLSQDDAKVVVLMMGINDIGWPGTGLAPNETPTTADAIITGYRQLIARAKTHDLKIIGATLTPFGDAFAGTVFDGYYTDDKEAMRLAVNDFIRNSGEFDGVIDFDAAVVDPDKPGFIRADFDKGDHLHPNPAGFAAMAKAIDLGLLTAE